MFDTVASQIREGFKNNSFEKHIGEKNINCLIQKYPNGLNFRSQMDKALLDIAKSSKVSEKDQAEIIRLLVR